jgi:hypothetical protein
MKSKELLKRCYENTQLRLRQQPEVHTKHFRKKSHLNSREARVFLGLEPELQKMTLKCPAK